MKKYEEKMWHATVCGNAEEFLRVVSADAVMVCGGYRCSGEEYSTFIEEFSISSYEITNFEEVFRTDELAQVCYHVRTEVVSEEDADVAGLFCVTSTWQKKDGEWKLIFNMDSRLELDEI